jgi:glycosyltransferase involved in cell wall biosynthesis
MRILMLAQFYLPDMGGEEHHIRHLSHGLAARGHDVAVATLWKEGLADFEMDGHVRVYRIRGTVQRARWLYSETQRRHAPPFPDPGAVRALRRVVAREQPEIVHAHNWLLHSFLPLKAWSGARLIVTLHDYSLLCAKKRLMYHGARCDGPGVIKCLRCASNHYGPAKGIPTALANWAMGVAERRAVDMFLTVSHATAAGNGLLGSRVPFQVIPNFLPDDLGEQSGDSDSRLAQLPDEDYLLFVGDLTPDKGVDVLLRAYKKLTPAPPLVLIGRPVMDIPAELSAGVTALKVWPHHAVMQAWRRCLVALAPSVWCEPFGMVVIEAMASGRPVIASRIGGLSDIVVDGETGLLVPPGDPEALQRAIECFLKDPGLRERMGQAGKRKVAEFRASAVVPRIEQVYRALIETAQATKKDEMCGSEEQYSCSIGQS